MPRDADLRYAIKVNDAQLRELQRNIRALNKEMAASERAGGGGAVAAGFDRADRSAKQATGSAVLFGSSVKSALKFGAAAGAGLTAFQGAKGFLAASSRDAREAERSAARLEAQLDASGLATERNIKAVLEATRAQAKWAGVIDDELVQDSLVNLLRTTGDVTRAIELNALALDIAAGKSISLEAASRLVARVYAGNIGALSRYAIVIDKSASSTEALTVLQERFAGQAEKAGKTADAAFNRTSLRVEELRERIGGGLNRALADNVLLVERLAGAAGAYDSWADRNTPDWLSLDPVVDAVSDLNTQSREAMLGIDESGKNAFANILEYARDAAEGSTVAMDLAAKRLERRLRASMVGRLNDVQEKALGTFDAETDALVASHDRISESLLSEFDETTDKILERMRVVVKVGASQFSISRGQRTPAERELEALDKIAAKRNLDREGFDAREDLAQASLIGDPEQIQDAKRRLEDVELERKKIKLAARAKTEREVANKALDAEEEQIRKSRDKQREGLSRERGDLRDHMSRRRSILRQNLDQELEAIESALKKQKTGAEQAQKAVIATLRKFGTDYRGVGAELGGKFLAGFLAKIYTNLSAKGPRDDRRGRGWPRRGGASGGMAERLGSAAPSDTIPAWLTPGEMVLTAGDQRSLARMIGTSSTGAGLLSHIRVGFAEGGVVDEKLYRQLLARLSRTIATDSVRRSKQRQTFASANFLTGKGMSDAERRMLSPIHLQSKLKNAVGDDYATMDRGLKLRLLGKLAQRQAHVERSGLVVKGPMGARPGSRFRDPGSGRMGGGAARSSFTFGDLNISGADLDVRDLAREIAPQIRRQLVQTARANGRSGTKPRGKWKGSTVVG